MGLSSSKIKHNESIQEGSVPSSTITPKPIRNLQDLDPRSPSLNIVRTPLELLSMGEVEDAAEVTITPLKAYKVLDVDPRSPAVEFNRTPIVINVDKPQPEKLKNKNLEKVLGSASPSPRLVGSRILTKPLEATLKRRSFAGLLETNIDFTETDLDAVARERYKGGEVVDNNVEGLEIKGGVNEACNVSEPFISAAVEAISEECIPLSSEATCDVSGPSTSAAVVETVSEECIPLSSEATGDVSEPFTSAVIEAISEEYIPLSSEPTNLIHKDYISLSHKATDLVSNPVFDDNIGAADLDFDPIPVDIPFSDEATNLISTEAVSDDLVATSENVLSFNTDAAESCAVPHSNFFNSIPDVVPTVPDNSLPLSFATPPNEKFSEIDLSADIREFDRKLTNLIYEDRDLIVCPKVVELRDVVERSPLRSLNLSEKKSAQKLRVSNKPRKSDYAVSKIPVFKDKRKSGGMQCENTPPAFLGNDGRAVGRRTRWDNADATLYL